MSATTAPGAKPQRDPAEAARRKAQQRKGDALFLGWVILFGALLVASQFNLLPVLPIERMPLRSARDWAEWMVKYKEVPVVLAVLYVVLVFGGKAYMEDKKPMDLRMPLALWSLLLAVFSLLGAVRTVPRVFDILRNRGVEHLVCGDTRYEWLVDDPAGVWTMVFCLSKIPELLDTFFIVARKKELITLHWYHHWTVMLFCWQSWATCCVNGIIFAAMNLSVHAIMYWFYALAALGMRPSTYAISITAGQIAQMVVGTAVTLYVTYDKLVWHPVQQVDFSFSMPAFIDLPKEDTDESCHVSSGNAVAGLVMYSSYLLLFVHFFWEAYLKPRAPGEKAKAE